MSQKEKVEVVIDSNEASMKPDVVELIALHEDVSDYRIKPLSEGDIQIDESCLFERKTPTDFASSLEEGRLRDQVERMGGREQNCYILIEGDMEDYENLTHTNISPKSLRGMEASIEMNNRIGVKHCSNISNLVDITVRLGRKAKEDVSVEARQTEALKDVSFIEKVFLAIDGVGVETAENLGSRFKTLSDALNAAEKDLQEVEGVGPERSKEVHTALHSRYESEQKTNSSRKQKVYNI